MENPFSQRGTELQDCIKVYAPITTQKLVQTTFALKRELAKLLGGLTATPSKGVWTDQDTGETWHDNIEIIEGWFNSNPSILAKIHNLVYQWAVQSGEKSIGLYFNNNFYLMPVGVPQRIILTQ